MTWTLQKISKNKMFMEVEQFKISGTTVTWDSEIGWSSRVPRKISLEYTKIVLEMCLRQRQTYPSDQPSGA